MQLMEDYKLIIFYYFLFLLEIGNRWTFYIGPILLIGFITILTTLAACPVTQDLWLFNFLEASSVWWSNRIIFFLKPFVMWKLESIPVYLLMFVGGGEEMFVRPFQFEKEKKIFQYWSGNICVPFKVVAMYLKCKINYTLLVNYEVNLNVPLKL